VGRRPGKWETKHVVEKHFPVNISPLSTYPEDCIRSRALLAPQRNMRPTHVGGHGEGRRFLSGKGTKVHACVCAFALAAGAEAMRARGRSGMQKCGLASRRGGFFF
jgi:hypothetical protein